MSPAEVVVVAPEGADFQVAVQPVEVPVVAAAPAEVLIVGAAAVGPPGSVGPFHEGHTFAVLGDLVAVFSLPGFFVPKHPKQTVKLAGVMADLASGRLDLQVRRNGQDVGAPIAVTPDASFTSLGGIELAHLDKISATLSGHAGPPNTLSATAVLEWSVP
jgi:hypothetical protein